MSLSFLAMTTIKPCNYSTIRPNAMYKYYVEIIEGTEKYILDELKSKVPDFQILKSTRNKIEFSSSEQKIDAIPQIFCALRIGNEFGRVINLFRRDWKKISLAAGINPALAYVMCKIADVQESDIVLDPCCGAGTIPITAALYFNPTKVIASDISGKAIEDAKTNSLAANLTPDKFFLFRKGVRDLVLKPGSVNKIITNLPFGIRTGNHQMNEETYENFAKKASTILVPGGKIVALTQEKELFKKYFNSEKLKIVEEMMVSQGGLTPNIFVVERV